MIKELSEKEILDNLIDRYGTSKNPFVDLIIKDDRKRLKKELNLRMKR